MTGRFGSASMARSLLVPRVGRVVLRVGSVQLFAGLCQESTDAVPGCRVAGTARLVAALHDAVLGLNESGHAAGWAQRSGAHEGSIRVA